jgi:hypothetical protein
MTHPRHGSLPSPDVRRRVEEPPAKRSDRRLSFGSKNTCQQHEVRHFQQNFIETSPLQNATSRSGGVSAVPSLHEPAEPAFALDGREPCAAGGSISNALYYTSGLPPFISNKKVMVATAWRTAHAEP